MITFGKNAANAALPTITYLSTQTDSGTANTYTFTSVSLGSVAEDRSLCFVVQAEPNAAGAENIRTVKVAGKSAQQLTNASFEVTLGLFSRIFILPLPGPETTEDIQIDMTGQNLQCVCHVYRLTGVDVFKPYAANSDSDDVVSMTVNVPENGILIGGAIFAGTADITVTGLTEDNDQTFDGNRFCAGSVGPITAETGRTISFDGSAGDAFGSVVVFSSR